MAIEFKELNKKEMGARIRARREALGMSRETLAKMIPVSAKTISNIEYGEKGISISNLYKLKQALGVSVDFLLDGDDAYAGMEEERKMLSENIISSLSVCSVKQLGCMEQMARIYVEGVVNND